ncbi:vacuolar protein sorting-associated protein [Microthyrium microscopicum]|uniref:Vacuolar protein sorting-associated protein 17 n=1 Tax=Microthyrium microscopicum TaxID=703497 RepID=A0A6A6UQC1_9PEZI|nr:vacuolar protein sorting-associated protein [Microthyrium microscopicum]
MNFSGADDHPEASPWATSPQPNHTTFAAAAAVSPSFPPAQESPELDHSQLDDERPFASPTQDSHHIPDSSEQDAPHPQEPRVQSAPAPTQASAKRQRQERPQYRLQAKVTGLERNGRKDPILKFDVYTNLPKYRTTQYRDVRRTHSEFTKYAEHLMSANPEALVPAVPASATAAGAGTEEDETKVKNNMQRWLNIVCANEILIRDEETQLFVESDFGYSPVVRRKQPATGMRRKVIKQFAPPPDETIELADARPIVKRFYLGTMDAGQKVDKVVKSRRSLGLAESQMGVTLSQMSPQEKHPGLAIAYRKLGATIRAVGDFHLAQGTFEASSLSDPLQYHSSDAFVVKETLTNRQILMRDLITARASTRTKLASAERLRSSSSVKRDKVDDAIAALEEAKRTEEDLDKKTQAVTKNLIGEQRRWFDRTCIMMRSSIREYVIRQIEAERRVLATLESVRPDIRNIDTSGGLSRLGREHHPKIRRSSLASSQGPKGDAWSGVQRRPDGVRRVESGNLAGLPVPEEPDMEETLGRERSSSKSGLKGLVEDDDEDRVDARNAASRLAQTTF